jgi:hypothetical protein
MALYTVNTGQTTAAADLNQVISLLSGTSSPVGSLMTVSNRVRAQLTGATATSGLVGSTVNGPPTSGTFALGDLALDTGYDCLWVCTTAGSSGSWKRIGGQTWLSVAVIPTGQTYPGGPLDPNTGVPLTPVPTATTQTFFARSGRTGFDVIQFGYEIPFNYPYNLPGYSQSAYGFIVPTTGTYLVRVVMQPLGPTGGTDLGVMLLKNGTVFQYGTEFSSRGSPVHYVCAIMPCTAGDLIQAGAYAEGLYSPSANGFSTDIFALWIGN